MFFVNSRAIIERTLNGTREIVVQTRNKTGEAAAIELPGGRIEPYESFVTALIREVQTLNGPFDSVGAYFRCKAAGELLASGDDTKNPRWVAVEALRRMMEEDPLQFSNVDRAGMMFYLKALLEG
ncbi:NUDIX hydrolase [Paenibacillus xanthanilyticus]|uniref:NUDIX hydrolase n=1 Tax=Paenibacillus xanthanilyticus TaxID=1783531 RepID=A0ABV8JVR5_9BACL